MNAEQRELARHALGLVGDRRRSYRNHFAAGDGHPDFPAWSAMVAAGLAKRRDGDTLPFGGDHLFSLTRAGALAALDPGEELDATAFPPAEAST